MSSKIDVPLADRLEDIAQDLTFMKDRNTIREAIALLAAPVVEHQPVNERAAFEKFCIDQADRFQPDLSRRGSHPESEYQRPSVQGHWEVWQARAAIYALPEFAELQATIDKLREGIAEHWKVVCDQRAEIERLKGGQGEPVAWRFRVSDLSDWFTTTRKDVAELFRKSPDGSHSEPLFTSQPAPVSVVLPSPDDLRYLISRAARAADLIPGANYYTAAELAAEALLDKVKELNQ
jgi:hypothetical protein